ncbi:GLPGLI family protein [Flavobacterium dankookense]|uniref:GLPGLI family protein n=1 Tax=Flavobacterium dankookense TaxID=706186 RepID=A0A4V3CSE8_9FLAO|nr:GLPGLI family protein [Flavobacterium dankookense]TDP60352.1 GLPGLI family protein [Flavobacterium dankookense]
MKKFFLIIYTICGTFCFSQSVEIKYFENEINLNSVEFKELPKNLQIIYEPNFYSYKLITDENQSSYLNEKIQKKFETEEVSETTLITENGDTIKKFIKSAPFDIKTKEKFIFKDFNKNKIYEELFLDEKFNVYDDIVEWNWEILNETEIFLGYKCKKAKSNSYGNEVIAWFTEDIPIANGPARFNGLPGLILKIKLSFLEINAYEVKFKKEKIKVEQPVLDKKTFTYAELMRKVNSSSK